MEAKQKKGLQALDWILLLLIALCIAAAVWFLKGRSAKAPQNTAPMAYTVLLADMPLDMADMPRVGGAVYNSNNGSYLGTLAEVRCEPAKDCKYNSSLGAYVEVRNPERYDVYVTVTAEGYETDSDVVIGGCVIKVGDELNIKGKGYAGIGFVSGLDTAYQG